MSLLLIIFFTGFITSCTKDEGFNDNGNNSSLNGIHGTSTKGSGIVRFVLTDAPFPTDMVAEANVTIDKIEIREESPSDTASSDSTKFITLSNDTQEFNLLDLRNGVTSVLTEAELGAGVYDQIRMHVVDANVVMNDLVGTTYKLKIPSGTTSGLKIKINDGLTVTDGSQLTVLLDFDVSKSFVVQGNPHTKAGIKGFLFKPVVRAVVEEATGTISGHVSVGDTTNVENANIEIYQMDSLITTALTDTAGYYAAMGLPVGSYDIKCIADGYDESDVNNISVSANDTTVVDISLQPSAASGGTGE